MVRYRIFGICLLLAALLCACGGSGEEHTVATAESIYVAETMASSAPAETVTEEMPRETEPTRPQHSALYLPGCTQEEMIRYFEEVVLSIEYTDGTGDADRAKKWLTPIYYQIFGDATEEDLTVLNGLCDLLNAVPGFPGIHPAEEPQQQNLSISFLAPADFTDSFSDVIHGEDAFGAVQFWYYTATNELHTARIGIRTDIDQTVRNSVLQEEIVNMLGLSDTVLRPDSITYQYSNDNVCLSDIDLVILKLLYDPAMGAGFDAETCSAVLQELYY